MGKLSSGMGHVCYVYLKNNNFICWGWEFYGQNAIPSKFKRNTRFGIAGGCHTCAVPFNSVINSMECWGFNGFGQLQIPTEYKTNIISIFLSSAATCALRNIPDYRGNNFKCWGSNDHGESDVPAHVFEYFRYKYVESIGMGGAHMCIIENLNSMVHCWGSNAHGQIAIPEGYWMGTTRLGLGSEHTCLVKGGLAKCFGDDNAGQSTLPYKDRIYKPMVYGMALYNHTCFIMTFKLLCFGINNSGQASVPEEIKKSRIINDVVCGSKHSCVENSDYKVTCFGKSGYNIDEVPKL